MMLRTSLGKFHFHLNPDDQWVAVLSGSYTGRLIGSLRQRFDPGNGARRLLAFLALFLSVTRLPLTSHANHRLSHAARFVFVPECTLGRKMAFWVS